MSPPPTSPHLPGRIEPRRLAGQGVDLHGIMDADRLTRLGEMVESIVSPIEVRLSFSVDEQGVQVVTGQIRVEVELVCQRCLGRMKKHLDCALRIGVVWSDDQARQLPSHLDPWILCGEEGDLNQLIEDELILSLPMFANHEEANCRGSAKYSTEKTVAKTENPFSILERLKH